MRRDANGTYAVTSTAGEHVRAFVPAPLPPHPDLVLDGPLQQALESAVLALGRLDGVSTLLPNHALFLYAYVRKEAVLSSQIEGTQSSLSDLLLFELAETPGTPLDDVREVSNYVAALDHGLRRLREDFPLSNRLLREIHGILLPHGRGSAKLPGEFRRSQNWIGGTGPGNAAFVPPPHTAVPDCMMALERFLHAEGDGVPVLLRAGLAHVQFETIHPFLDGNGRVGRLLITLLLCHAGTLSQPLLYLSLYFKQHRGVYYEMLDRAPQRRLGIVDRLLSRRSAGDGRGRGLDGPPPDPAVSGRSAPDTGGRGAADRIGPAYPRRAPVAAATVAARGAARDRAVVSSRRIGHGAARYPRDRARDHRQTPGSAVRLRPVSCHSQRRNRGALTLRSTVCAVAGLPPRAGASAIAIWISTCNKSRCYCGTVNKT